nr:helix-turn-helix domain-containing protein [Butyrivibrio sp.]
IMNLLGFMQAGSIERFRRTLKEIDGDIRNSGMEEVKVKLFLSDIMIQIKDQICHLYPEMGSFFDSNSELLEIINKSFYLYEIMKYIDGCCVNVIKEIRQKSGASSTVEDVISYIDRNYSEALTLEEVAPLFGYNSVYFGKLFSKATNSTFNCYLNDRRIEEAKKLLEDNELKIYEIAAKTGYNDVDYFSKKFKQKEGMSPADYRRNLKQSGGV